jgi:hypothetical protein
MDEDEVTRIVRSLAQYVRAHPLACDSAQGIAQWWLPDDDTSMDALERALAWLTRHRVLEATAGGDGRTRYRRRCDDAELDAALALRSRARGQGH